MEYSVTVWRTPVREWKEVLYRLTYRREWIQELNCWRDMLVRQERDNVTDRMELRGQLTPDLFE